MLNDLDWISSLLLKLYHTRYLDLVCIDCYICLFYSVMKPPILSQVVLVHVITILPRFRFLIVLSIMFLAALRLGDLTKLPSNKKERSKLLKSYRPQNVSLCSHY